MTVVEVNQIAASAAGTAEGERDYEVIYEVITDDPTDGPLEVRYDILVPQFGSVYTYGADTADLGAYWTGSTARLRETDGSRRIWRVAVQFSTRPDRRCQDAQIDDPLLLPEIWTGDWTPFTRTLTRDKDNQAITNSAGQQIYDEIEDQLPNLVCVKNLAALDFSLWSDYADDGGSVNSDVWLGIFPVRTVRFLPVTFTPEFRGLCAPYWRVTFRFQIKWNKWDRKYIDRGFYELFAGELTPIKAQGRDLTEPALLNGAGLQLPAGQPAVVLTKRVNPEKPFTLLGLTGPP